MLSTDPKTLLEEIRRAEELRKKVLTNTTNLVRRYVGNWYRTDSRTKPRPENMIFSFVATTVGNLVYSNPGAKVKPKRSQSHADLAKFMEAGLNGWIEDVCLRDELEILCYDYLFGFAVAKVGLEERPDSNGGHRFGVFGHFNMEALMPFGIRLDPANVLIDADATHWRTARLLGHQFQRDLDDLQLDERYDQAAVAQLTADDEPAVGRSNAERNFAGGGKNKSNERQRVTLYELYFPETRQVGTLALYGTQGGEQQAGWVRPLQDFHGPEDGPYVFYGCYTVPGSPYPLSPIAAIAEQDAELNAHAAAAAKEAASAKNLLLVDANQPEVATAVGAAPTNGIVTVKGLNGQNVIPVALGGTTQQRIEYLNLLLQRTDRIAGQSENARGKAQGVTATEANLANQNSDAREEFVTLKFTEGVSDLLYRVGWYFFNDPAVVSIVSMQDPATGQEFEGVFLGGQQPGEDEGSDWLQFNLSIDPMSMKRIDPMQQMQQANTALQLALGILPMIPTIPYANWTAILDLAGDAANLPDFAKMILNGQGMMMIQAAQMGMPVAPMPGQPGMGGDQAFPGAMPQVGGRSAQPQLAGPGAGGPSGRSQPPATPGSPSSAGKGSGRSSGNFAPAA